MSRGETSKGEPRPLPPGLTTHDSRLVQRIARSRRSVIGLALLAVVALAAPRLAPLDPMAMNPRLRLLPPLATSSAGTFHSLGTNQVGRDVFSRVAHAGRVSLSLSLGAVALGGAFGVAVGLLTGYVGGAVDAWLMRLADVQLAMPTILLAIDIVAISGRGLGVLVLALATWIIFARTVRGTTLALRRAAFVEAVQAASSSATSWATPGPPSSSSPASR